jgi:uncharacterized protein with HEPN domain
VTRERGRSARKRLEDVLEAICAIRAHLERGGLEDSLVFDAVRMRLVEIGEAVNDVPADLLATEAEIPWKEVVAMRHKLAHHYFDTAHGIVAGTVEEDLPVLEAAVVRLIRRSG